MWRRIVSWSSSTQLQTLAAASSRGSPSLSRSDLGYVPRRHLSSSPSPSTSSSVTTQFQRSPCLLSQHAASASANNTLKKNKVEDIMSIATGHELEELEAELEGKNILEMNYPVGPFGTKEAPAVVKSVYDKRIVGCPGSEGEDEHDVVWFWLEKGKPHECLLEVVGPGGPPDGHGDDDHH